MKTMRTWAAAAAAALLAAAGAAQAALINRGNGMIYDTTLNITWMADMNYALTSGYAAAHLNVAGGTDAVFANGRMGWQAANDWANGLVYGGFDDWRLPTLNTADTTCSDSGDAGSGYPREYFGYHCTGGELSHLLVVDLGEKTGETLLNTTGDTAIQRANLALFRNIVPWGIWSGTDYLPPNYNDLAWGFDTEYAIQYARGAWADFYAVAVRSGDVAAPAAVPEPQTLALVLTAIGAALLACARRPARGPDA